MRRRLFGSEGFYAGRAGVLLSAGLMLFVVAPAHAAPGAHGPGGEHLDAPAAASNSGGLARLPDGSVNVPKIAQRRMDIRTVLAVETEAAASVELPARVLLDPNAASRVQAVYGGRVAAGPQGLPVVGQRVKRGQVLAIVRHQADPFALGNQRAQLSDLRGQRALAEQRLQRLEGLEGTVPRKEIEAARNEALSLQQREASIGRSLDASETLLAPISGVVARSDVLAGQVVEARDLLFEVIDPARMLIEATTADAGLPARIAAARLASMPQARLELLGAARVLRDGVLPLTFSVRAADAGKALPLAIGQPVTVIVALNERTRGIVLPAQAVVRNPANEPVVWIKSGAERFIPQPVQMRALDAQTVIVTQGMGADNRVVVQGAPLISQIR